MRISPSRRGYAAAAVVAALCLGLVAAAGADQRPEREDARAAATRTARVAIRGFAYHPPTLRVRRGARVVFVNRDRAPHTATRRGSFDTGRLRSGARAAVRFKRRGTYRYICTIHPSMRGTIVVR